MKPFISIIAVVAVIASTVSALPAAAAVSKQFKIRTQVINGMAGFDGQYLSTAHTGAGTAAAILTKGSYQLVGQLNGTSIQFLDGDAGFSMGFEPGHDEYAGWGGMVVTVNRGNPAVVFDGFTVGPEGYISHNKNEPLGGYAFFNGWRVCNWFHDAPELFYNTPATASADMPTSCADVFLVAEYV